MKTKKNLYTYKDVGYENKYEGIGYVTEASSMGFIFPIKMLKLPKEVFTSIET